jgi:DNA-binding NtrC family response regulator
LSTQAEAVRAPNPAAHVEPGRDGITVLLVEDERFVRQAAAHILQSAGYRVRQARNAAEARRESGMSGGVQILLTDVILPDANGRDLAEELAAAHPGVRSIFMSGYPENALTQDNPAILYLAKPFSVESLTTRMIQAERALRARRAVS